MIKSRATIDLQAQIRRYCPEAKQIMVEWHDQLASTQDRAALLAVEGVPEALCLADVQQAGRGQQGRQWYAELGQLMMSWLTTLPKPVEGKLGLIVAANLANQFNEWLSATTGLWHVGVKWPNDLLLAQRSENGGDSIVGKLGGLLIEPVGTNQVVIGLGLNLKPQPDVPQTGLLAPADWSQTGENLSQAQAALLAIQAFYKAITAWSSDLTTWQDDYERCHLLHRRKVKIHSAQLDQRHWPLQIAVGMIQGVSHEGALYFAPQLDPKDPHLPEQTTYLLHSARIIELL